MTLDKFAYVGIVLAMMAVIMADVGLAQAISFESAMLLLGGAFVVSLALIWSTRKKSR